MELTQLFERHGIKSAVVRGKGLDCYISPRDQNNRPQKPPMGLCEGISQFLADQSISNYFLYKGIVSIDNGMPKFSGNVSGSAGGYYPYDDFLS